MENNSPEDRKGGKLTDPIHHPHILSNWSTKPLLTIWGWSRHQAKSLHLPPKAKGQVSDCHVADPWPEKAAPSPSPALPTVLQLQKKHVTACNKGLSNLFEGSIINYLSKLNHMREHIIIFAYISFTEHHIILNYGKDTKNTLALLAKLFPHYYFHCLHISVFSTSQLSCCRR